MWTNALYEIQRGSSWALSQNGDKRLSRGCFIPAQLCPHHIKECAAAHVLSLQAASQDVRTDKVARGCYVTGVADQVIIAPAAAIQPLPIPAHRRVEPFIQPTQREECAV